MMVAQGFGSDHARPEPCLRSFLASSQGPLHSTVDGESGSLRAYQSSLMFRGLSVVLLTLAGRSRTLLVRAADEPLGYAAGRSTTRIAAASASRGYSTLRPWTSTR